MTSRTMLSLAGALLLAGAAALPATAATTSGTSYTKPAATTSHSSHTHFYVSLKGKAHACTILTHKPSHNMMVGTHSYHSHAAAAHAMAAAKICRA